MAKKPAWLYVQSAVVPYLVEDGVVKIALITSSSGEHWVIPKGIVERGMTPEASAAKEALEEAGLLGEVSSPPLGEYEYEKWGGVCHVKVYPMRITAILEAWDEAEVRARKLLPFEEALVLIRDLQRFALVKLGEILCV